MGLAFFAFIAIFLLIGSAGVLIASRSGMTQRLATVVTPNSERRKWWRSLKADRASHSIKAVIQPLDRLLPKSPQEVSVVQKRLIRAGLREDSYVRLFYGAKVLVPLFSCALVAVTGVSRFASPFFTYALALGMGYLIPDFWLGRRIKRRQTEIRIGLPEFLDLLVVCIEAGLSLDQALVRTVEELNESQPDIADEMSLVILEQRAGRPRIECWKNLAERTDLDVVRMLVSAIVQADQFGTSISKTLRVYSEGLRTQRRQQVEEMAAKTPVKLVFPLVLFIFPSLFLVTLGPALISMSESFSQLFK